MSPLRVAAEEEAGPLKGLGGTPVCGRRIPVSACHASCDPKRPIDRKPALFDCERYESSSQDCRRILSIGCADLGSDP